MSPFLPLLAAQDAPAEDGGDLLALAGRGAAALLVGLLVGAERGQSHPEKDDLVAGVRTFPLIALLGSSAALIAELARAPLVLAVVAGALAALLLA